jgi:hypothetical protein
MRGMVKVNEHSSIIVGHFLALFVGHFPFLFVIGYLPLFFVIGYFDNLVCRLSSRT